MIRTCSKKTRLGLQIAQSHRSFLDSILRMPLIGMPWHSTLIKSLAPQGQEKSKGKHSPVPNKQSRTLARTQRKVQKHILEDPIAKKKVKHNSKHGANKTSPLTQAKTQAGGSQPPEGKKNS